MSEELELQAKPDDEIVESLRSVMSYQAYTPPDKPYIWAIYGNAALRTIDRLRAENERLRAAFEGVPDMLQVAGMLDDMDEDMISKAHALRAALASADRDGAGTAAGDATAGDGDGGAE